MLLRRALPAIAPLARAGLAARFASAAAPLHHLNLDEGSKTLAAVLGENKQALAYFTASWCGPCKAIGPHFLSLAEKHGQAVRFVKIDVDDNGATAEEVRAFFRAANFLRSYLTPPSSAAPRCSLPPTCSTASLACLRLRAL